MGWGWVKGVGGREAGVGGGGCGEGGGGGLRESSCNSVIKNFPYMYGPG